jgi:hypothetical protein
VSAEGEDQFFWLDEHGPFVNGCVGEAAQAPLLRHLDASSLLANVRLTVSNRKCPQLQTARNLAYHRVEVGHMLEHITAVGKVELAGRYGQPLPESNLIVDIETRQRRGDVQSRSTPQKDEGVVFLPPALAFAVIHIVVDRHFTISGTVTLGKGTSTRALRQVQAAVAPWRCQDEG